MNLALHQASQAGDLRLLTMLLEAGADKDCPMSCGVKPIACSKWGFPYMGGLSGWSILKNPIKIGDWGISSSSF